MAPDETQSLEAGGDGHRTRRREAILNAAERLFIEQGFDRTSRAEIARCSGEGR